MRCHFILPLCFLLVSASIVRAQSRKFVIAVIGSSTAEGVGANPIDSSWVNRTKQYFKQLGESDTIYNIALGGQTSYDGMPTGFIPPSGRPAPDTATNVTKALSFHPDIVLVSFPTNDAAADYTITETMSNLRAIYKKIRAAGKVCYMTTSQPRSSVAVVQQELLKRMRDSVLAEFRGNSLNFYNPIVATDSLSINPIYNFDGTHVNDAGHRQLFQVVRQANILSAFAAPLALNLVDFSAVPEGRDIVLRWTVANEVAPVTMDIQRSGDGNNFSDIWQEPASTADSEWSTLTWTDDNPLPGNSYYRLKYSPDGNSTSYSGIVEVDLTAGKFGIGKFYTATGAGSTRVEVLSPSTRACTIMVVNATGQFVYRQVTTVSPPWNMITLPTGGWAPGEYFLRLVTDKGEVAARAFMKF
jgi:lysophospholipase L1-like esterase